eukprot:CAMPEP_0114176054 /NCGR_PEP_ID=MMETSP0043_2-20121206/37288_1 /TAXON_ID=464988 /ORGANISM="Hemiselmis andersenii, Strain CCMP644" /LENGTH=50 /DNA_ID=CAMNT_0001274339 /DNA_START=181 /DNA_END=333 /DNA_ORIENTATION=+
MLQLMLTELAPMSVELVPHGCVGGSGSVEKLTGALASLTPASLTALAHTL